MITGRQRSWGYRSFAVLQFLLTLLLVWLSADVEAHHQLHGFRQEAVHYGTHLTCSHHPLPDTEPSGAEHEHGGCIITLFQQGKIDSPFLPVSMVMADLCDRVPVMAHPGERPPPRSSVWLPYSCGPPA